MPWTPASWTSLCRVRPEGGGEGNGREGGGQKDWGKGEPSAFTPQLIPSTNTPEYLIIGNHSRCLVSTYSIPGLVPSTSEASSHLSGQQSWRPLPFHTPVLLLRKLRPREMKSHFFIRTSFGLRPPGYMWQNWYFNPALSDPTFSIRNCVNLHVPASCQVTL